MAYEKQTWANGDIITAEKLNHMEDGISSSGASYDLVLTEIYPSEGDPVMTGHGLSFEELMEKIDNGDDVSVKYIQHNQKAVDGAYHYHSNSIQCEHDAYDDSSDTLKVYGTKSGAEVISLIEYSAGEYVTLLICGYTYYNFTYNATTKAYTFTFDFYVD